DCVGSGASLAEALAVVRPGGRITLVGMPGPERIDLTPLWQREVELVGAYAYGTEDLGVRRVRTFELAFDLVHGSQLGRLVSARYPLERYREAIEHAATAGSRGAVKIVFEPRSGGAGAPAGQAAGVFRRNRVPDAIDKERIR
ncbi:MAG: zinc-binding dehydrogenase, partial [bacterium]